MDILRFAGAIVYHFFATMHVLRAHARARRGGFRDCPGRQMKCAAGGGGDGVRIGGERVGWPFGLQNFDIIFVLSGIEDHGGADIPRGEAESPKAMP